MDQKKYDVSIIGAGVVGLAAALQIAKKNPKLKIPILKIQNENINDAHHHSLSAVSCLGHLIF